MTSHPGRAAPRRGEVLRSAVAWIEDRRDGELPAGRDGADRRDGVDGVAATFGSTPALVCGLQSVWRARVADAVTLALAGTPADPARAVARAWADTAARHPGLRRALDAAAGSADPAVAMAMGVATAREQAALAIAAGTAARGDSALVARGEEIQRSARALPEAGRPTRSGPGRWPDVRSWVKMAV